MFSGGRAGVSAGVSSRLNFDVLAGEKLVFLTLVSACQNAYVSAGKSLNVLSSKNVVTASTNYGVLDGLRKKSTLLCEIK